LHISFLGYNGSTIVQTSSVYIVSNTEPTLITLNWLNITKLLINIEETDCNSHMAMDDFTFLVDGIKVDAGKDQIINLGYGPQCETLSAQASEGTPPYRYTWSPGGFSSSSVKVCPTTTTTYTVTVTDATGNTATDEVTVKVKDARCGHKGDKVMVCHKGKTLCIGSSAVAAHIKHGDRLGSCGTSSSLNSITETTTDSKLIAERPQQFLVSVAPNPVSTTCRFQYDLPSDGRVAINVFDVIGRQVITVVQGERKAGVYSNDVRVAGLTAGVYYYQALFTTKQNTLIQTGKVIIAR
jgi:hypothetical protein